MEAHASEIEHADGCIGGKQLGLEVLTHGHFGPLPRTGFQTAEGTWRFLGGGNSEGESGQDGFLQLAMEGVEASQQLLTTIVVRNIPRHFHVRDLLNEMQPVGFNKFVTLVNLPQDRKKSKNRGYAFVNCATPDAAFCLLKALNGHQWHGSSDTAMADWAIVQGHEANAALAQAPLPRRRRGGTKPPEAKFQSAPLEKGDRLLRGLQVCFAPP